MSEFFGNPSVGTDLERQGVTLYMMEPRPEHTREELIRRGCQENCREGWELQLKPSE